MVRHNVTVPPPAGSSSQRCVRRVLGMVAWVSLLVTVAVGGRALARGTLAPPPLGHPGSWAEWASGRTPVEATFAVLGLVVVALAWYLLAATVLMAVARCRGAGRLASVAEVLTVALVRRTVQAVLGFGLVGSSVAGATSAMGPPPPGHAWLEPTVELVVATVPDEPTAVGDESPPVMRLLPDESQDEAPSTPARRQLDPPASAPQGLPAERQVHPGEHLWSIAAQILEEAGGPATDDEVATYWRRLVGANLDRLADPANPDLIFPGQLLAVPALAAPAPAPAP